MLEQITPLILTLNEAPNIRRTLEQLSWAKDIVVVDSASTDATLAILSEFATVRAFQHAYVTHAEKWSFGLSQTQIGTEWVLALDADYILSDQLVHEMDALRPEPDVAGYRVNITYCVEGKPLRGSVYPPVVALYRRSAARYVQDGHTQRVQLDGRVEGLSGRIFHDDRKPLGDWFAAQARNMRLESEKLVATPFAELSMADWVRRMIILAPAAMLFLCLFVRGNILDGRAGIFYAMQRATAEMILSLYLLQKLLRLSA